MYLLLFLVTESLLKEVKVRVKRRGVQIQSLPITSFLTFDLFIKLSKPKFPDLLIKSL